MAETNSNDPLINEITERIKRELLANRSFVTSIMKGIKLTSENIDPDLILTLMASMSNYKQPPVPKTNKPTEMAKGGKDTCSKPITVSDNSLQAKVVADFLTGNNVYLWGRAGTGKSYLAKALAECVMRQDIYLINCSQWTSPIEIRGGQTIKGYTEGTMVKAWMYGGVLLADELPKLDPNTAGLFNEALAETAAQPRYDKSGKVIPHTIPYITNGRGQSIYKGQGLRQEAFDNYNSTRKDNLATYPEWYPIMQKQGKIEPIVHEFRFTVVATGNTDLKSVNNKFSGNQRQDYSLVDRFVGSFYKIDYNRETEMQLTYSYVYNVCNAMREYLDSEKEAIESISLRTMLNFDRTYEQEMLARISSPFADEIYDNDGKRINTTKTLRDSIDSFVGILPPSYQEKLSKYDRYVSALARVVSEDEFIEQFKKKYNFDPVSGKELN